MTFAVIFRPFTRPCLLVKLPLRSIATSLLANVSSTLPPTQAGLCDGPLDHDECFVALNERQVALVGRSTHGTLCKVLVRFGC